MLQRSQALAVWLSATACLLVAYVLSFGPVIGLAARGCISARSVQMSYAPILYMADHSEVADSVINGYASFFVPTAPPGYRPLTASPLEQ